LPRKSDAENSAERDPARKPIRNSTAKSRTLSRNTAQLAPSARTDGAPRKPRDAAGERSPYAGKGERAPRKDFSDRPPRGEWKPRGDGPPRTPREGSGERTPYAGSGERAPRKDFSERPPRGEWKPRGDGPPRAPREGSGERTPYAGSGERAPRKDFSDRPPRGEWKPRGDGPPRTPREGSGERTPYAGNGERTPRKDFSDRPPRGEWKPRGDGPSRAPREGSGERTPYAGGGERTPRKDFSDRPPRGEWKPRGDGPPRAPREAAGERPPRRDAGDRPPRAAKPASAPLRPAKPWDERTTDKRGRVQAVQRDDSDDEGSKDGVRVSRYLADRGAASRREADDWIARGWVTVDGETAVLGQRVLSHQKVEVHKQARDDQALRVTVLLHKPVGYVSGQAEDGHQPASVLFLPENQWSGDTSGQTFNRNHLRGLAPAGRLDIDSHGLLVLTQDGRVARVLIGEDSTIEKEYLVRVRAAKPFGNGPLSETFPAESMALLNHGLELDEQPLKPAKVSWQNEEQLRFVLREGKKRQIRRMCEGVGLEVVALKRVRIGRVPLADLPVGKWRYLRKDELF
jgi:23S rRNA pseudouridine2604 synthase